jgi:hypothetical protein
MLTIELGFQHLSMLYCPLGGGLVGLILGGSTEDMVEQHLFSKCFTVSIGGE